MDSTSCEYLLFMSWKGIIKPQSRSHNTRKFTKGKNILFLKSLLHVIIFATVKLSTDASSTEMANKKKQSKIKP